MIRYPAALLSRASNPAGGRRFLQYLQGTEARAAFLAAGFRMASGTAGRP
jgi:ABC-type molybdate transport system substrate-binding protein